MRDEQVKLYQGDCLEVMKEIPDKSVDCIICDLPYGTTSCSWDSIIPFEPLWEQYKRIIKTSGNILLFGSQPFTSKLICSNLDWFSYSVIWKKEQGTNFLLANKMPLKIHEDICVFRKPDTYGVDEFIELRAIFKDIFNSIGLKKSEIKKVLGQGLDHCFRFDSSQWGLPTEKNYIKLLDFYKLEGFPKYGDLKAMYDNSFFRVYNPQLTKGKSYVSGKGSSGEVTGHVNKVQTVNNGTRKPTSILEYKRETGLHPTQKPVELLEYLIKTYSNEDEIVLDNTMGSGSTGVACINTNRKFIGIELDENYFNISKERIENTYIKLKTK